MQQKKFGGFTLVEMLVVIGIIGILTTMILVSVGRVRKNAIDTRRKSNVEDVRGAITMFYAAKSVFPTETINWSDSDINRWNSLVSTLSTAGYLSNTIASDEDGDGTADYIVNKCTSVCAMQLCTVCILTDGESCVNGKYCVDVK